MPTSASPIPATPAKLRDGSWGARTTYAAADVGDVLTITTKGGKTWDAVITRVVWRGEDAALCATRSASPAPRASSPRKTGAPRMARPGSGKCRERGCGNLADPGYDGYCKSCHFDEYDC